jgi:glycosyltransferase involved in cell wall biosynthesis
MFCFSVLEAMSAAKPVISYKLDAVKEFFDTDEWLADNPDDMLNKTEKLINLKPNEREAIGAVNYQNYLKHSAKNFAQRIIAEYQLAMNPNKSAPL